MFNVCFYFIVIKTYKNHNNNIFRHNIPRKSFVLSLFFHIIAKFHLLAVMWFHLIIRYCIFCNEFQKLILCQSCCLKYIKTKFIQYFYFSFIKQRKPNDTTVSITLPVIPDAPPPGAAVEPPGAAALDPWHNPAMSEIVVCRGKTSAYD